jgi:hypothetical protein
MVVPMDCDNSLSLCINREFIPGCSFILIEMKLLMS